MNWYYAQDGKPVGPVSDADLAERARSGRLAPADLVWNETMGQQWARADSVAGLFPPPVPGARTAGAGPAPAADAAAAYPTCSGPVSAAWARMKQILFAPFDMGKWFVIGFAAWLATLGEGGGGFNPSGLADLGKKQPEMNLANRDYDQALAWVKGVVRQHLDTILLIGTAVFVLVLGLSILLLWLRCRGKFMFLDNVLNNRADVGGPWTRFAQHGNALFRWMFVYGLVCLLMFGGLLAAGVYAVAIPCFKAHAFLLPSVMPAAAVLLAMFLLLGIVAAYIARFTEDFIVPLMYKHDLTTNEAWRRFMPLLKAHLGLFVRYGFFYLLLGIVAGLCVIGVVLITCCIAGCLMAIPYIGAVVLLPMTTFFRLYSVGFLAQFGPDYRLEPDQPTS